MRKVINGAVYDSETSERLFSKSEHGIEFYEALHRTKSGKYFVYRLVGEDSEIMPLSRKRAIIWAFSTSTSERDIRRAFGASDEEGTKQVSLRLPMNTYHILREAAADQGISMAAYITNLINANTSNQAQEAAKEDPKGSRAFNEADHRLAYLEALPEKELYDALSQERAQETERIKETKRQFKDKRKRLKKMSPEERSASINASASGKH